MTGLLINASVSCIEMKKTSTNNLNDEVDAFKLDDAIGHLLRRAYQRTSAILTSQIGEYDITPVQFASLARLYEYGSVSQNHLGRLVDIEPGNFHGVVNRLVTRKLVVKRKDTADRRKIKLSLSNAGLELIDLLIPMSKLATSTTLVPLTENQRAQLYKLLRQILEDTD